ncbi:hypothetical protein IHE44_0004827 [Lamprotornis superbus]|uniref:Uncharacterized protein n=1 Tax=Lamprotornis superbus TaxID=245042 RepID=A0A835NCN7_9PASS|nr:hypothetical protein IHE44_0004827 [Lamprotornis superbus]
MTKTAQKSLETVSDKINKSFPTRQNPDLPLWLLVILQSFQSYALIGRCDIQEHHLWLLEWVFPTPLQKLQPLNLRCLFDCCQCDDSDARHSDEKARKILQGPVNQVDKSNRFLLLLPVGLKVPAHQADYFPPY